MRVFLLTDADMAALIEKCELIKLRKTDHLGTHDPKRHEIDDMHRAFHMAVVTWTQEHGYRKF